MNKFVLLLAVILVSSVAGDSLKTSSSVKKDLSFSEVKHFSKSSEIFNNFFYYFCDLFVLYFIKREKVLVRN